MILLGDLLLAVALLYVLVGAGYALHFCTKVAGAVNVRARFSSPLFRLMLAPGAALLWPLLLSFERRGQLGSDERSGGSVGSSTLPGQGLPTDASGSKSSALGGDE